MTSRTVMLLAAGRGERMRPLTDTVPKPLLPVAGRPLVLYLIESLAAAGFCDVVINHAHLGHQFEEVLGDGRRHGVTIRYSSEPAGGLETAGGIRAALGWLPQEFVVVNADLWTDFPWALLTAPLGDDDARLVLVDNPDHHPRGDFALEQGRVSDHDPRLTFAGIGRYARSLFERLPPGRAALAPILREAMGRGRVAGLHFRGLWMDVGTPERLAALDRATRERHDA